MKIDRFCEKEHFSTVVFRPKYIQVNFLIEKSELIFCSLVINGGFMASKKR